MSVGNVQDLYVDLNQYNNFKPVIMKQFDKNTRTIEITLTDSDGIYTIPSGVVAKIQCTKPDGTIIFDDCIIKNDVIIYVASEQLTAIAGEVKCEIGLYEPDINNDPTKDKLLQSATFIIIVKETAMDRNAVVSSNEFNTLTIMINTISGLVEQTNTTLALIDEAITNAEEATNATNQAILDANTATTSANTATTNANNAVNLVNQTNSDIQNAESLRNTAEQTRESQEITRQTNTATAITNANTATDRANLAAQNAEDIVAGVGVIMESSKGIANGVASLDENAKVPLSQLPNIASSAQDITYDNTTSGLTSTNTQSAIDELDTIIGDLSQLNTTSNTDLVGGINENTSHLASISINVKYPPVPMVSAKGDGITNDTSAIQNCINYASSNGCNIVFLPTGKYNITSTITIPENIKLHGCGRKLSILVGSANELTMILMSKTELTRSYNEITSIGFESNALNITAIKSVLCSMIKFHDLYFAGVLYVFNLDRGHNIQISSILTEGTPTQLAGKSIFQDTSKIDHIYDIQISDYQIRNIGNGVQSPAMEFNRAVGTFLNEFRSSDLGMANGVLYSGDCQGCKISNSIIVHSNEYAIKYILEGATSPIAMTITDVDIDQAQLNGIQIDAGHWITVNGGHITTIGQHGISCGIGNVNDAGNIFILGVNIVDCTNQGIQIAPNTGAFNIFNSHIEQTDCAIYISAGSSDYYMIQNNDLTNLNTSKIIDGGTGTNKIVKDNLGVDSVYKREYVATTVLVLTGGTISEKINISIPIGLFGEKPIFGIISEQTGSAGKLIGYYRFDDVSNSATNAVFELVKNDGTALSAGTYRFGVLLKS